MEFEIISEKDNPVLKRKEVLVGIKGTGATPPRKEVVASVASHFNVSESLILVDQILTEFGTPNCRAKVKIYQDAGDIPKKRLAIVKARSKPAGGKKEETSEEKKEEKPAEKPVKEEKQVAEETKEEEKKDDKA